MQYNISLSANDGEIFGFLGSNDAGKLATINILTAPLKPTRGKVLVGGYDVVEKAGRVREIIGYIPQDITVDGDPTGWEDLMLQAMLLSRSQEHCSQASNRATRDARAFRGSSQKKV
uniref:ATP-binding cassette domain-containing protein n=1 Tax=Fervidicoccus fontis TaxID=683846 RepID=A0A7J3ZNL8_9CREN